MGITSILNDPTTTVRSPPCVVHKFLRPSVSFLVFMVKLAHYDVAELVADYILSFLPSHFPDIPTDIHPFTPNYTSRYGTRWLHVIASLFHLPALNTRIRFSPHPNLLAWFTCICLFSLPSECIAYLFCPFSWVPIFYTHCWTQRPLFFMISPLEAANTDMI